MNTYAYARVSSYDQNLARQLQRLQDFGINAKHIFFDKKSGKDSRRGCIWWLQTSYGNAADRTARRHFGDRREPFERDTGLYQCCRSRIQKQDALHIFGERLFV